jgi:hypothetical protein
MNLRFSVTFDYRCPFARNAHEHVLDGLAAGAAWFVRFMPFSLSQSKEATWDAEVDSGLLALQLGVAVRDGQPDAFPAAHRALFGVRHDRGLSLRDPEVLRATLQDVGADADAAFAAVASGEAVDTVRREHEEAVREQTCWGVPTFAVGEQAAFVRLMQRPGTSEAPPVEVVERIVGLLGGWPDLNEFKHTSLPR